ncbi:hypothetical protein ACJ41O_008839 [Fusarium nematophilum]
MSTEPRLACLVCRQRKVACDRQRPRCGLCSKNDFDCQYKSRQHRPGLRAGYVSRLERQLGDVQDRLRKVEAHLEQRSPGQFTTAGSTATASSVDDNIHLVSDYSAPVAGDMDRDQSPSYLAEAASQSSVAGYQTPTSSPDGLLFSLANRSLKIWFRNYHPWFPIIHQSSLQDISGSTDPRYELVWKALTAVVTFDQVDIPHWERALAEQMRDQVMLQGLRDSSLQSIQALLILSNHYYAEGSLTQFWNMLAICKKSALPSTLGREPLADLTLSHRMTLHPRLHGIAAFPSWAYSSRVQLAQRSVPGSVVEKEEAVRAYWMVEMLDSISTLGGSNYSMPSRPPSTAALPCPESTWALREPVVEQPGLSSLQYPSSFALCVVLAMEELGAIRQFLAKPYELTRLDQRLEWQSEAQRLDERLTNWREEFVANVFRLINIENEQLPRGEMEPFFTLTNCILNTAIIVLLQQMAPFPKDIERDFEPWAFATTRCVYACENLAAKVRRIGADQLDSQPPYLIMPVFVAARFYVAYSKALDADVPANLHTLAFMLHTCGKRWPLAHRYETIIRTAVAEHRSPISECVLPVEFYDFRLSTLEITDLLQDAAERLG